MTLGPEDRQAIIDYRTERALKALTEAEFVAKGNFWNLAANRLYYSAFYICEALLLSKQISTTTHAGISRMMNLHFFKTGILDEDTRKLMSTLFRMRQTGDYDDMLDWSEEDIVPLIPKARGLVERVKALID